MKLDNLCNEWLVSFEKMTDILTYMFLSESVQHGYAILKLRSEHAQFHNLHSVYRKCLLSFQNEILKAQMGKCFNSAKN